METRNAPDGSHSEIERKMRSELLDPRPRPELTQARTGMESVLESPLLRGLNQEFIRRCTLVSAFVDAHTRSLTEDICDRLVPEAADCMAAVIEVRSGASHEVGMDVESARKYRQRLKYAFDIGYRMVATLAKSGAFDGMERADVKMWWLDTMACRMCDAANFEKNLTDAVRGVLMEAGVQWCLEHAEDPSAEFMDLFPTDMPGFAFSEDDPDLDKIEGNQAPSVTMLRTLGGFAHVLPGPGYLEGLLGMLIRRFMRAELIGWESSRLDEKTYSVLERASGLRHALSKRPLDNMPDIDCTDFVASRLPKLEGLSVKKAILAQDPENPDTFRLNMRFLRTSDSHILSGISGKGLSFDRAAKRSAKAWFDGVFHFDKKSGRVLRTWDPSFTLVGNPLSPDKEWGSWRNEEESIGEVVGDLLILEILARSLARDGRAGRDTAIGMPTPARDPGSKRRTIRIGADDPVILDPPSPVERSGGEMPVAGAGAGVARQNFGRRAWLVFLPEAARPSQEAYERARLHGVDLYAYLVPRGDGKREPLALQIPDEGLHFLVSHLPYEAMLRQADSLMRMYGGATGVELRVSTYRRAVAASAAQTDVHPMDTSIGAR